ncbi:hypothetical protein Glove_103g265 [Diversispora epigaea]|uniref:Uncharacterized protein n=1 Tax=Diversispora epigaea TaxID=1348612 RepID=A0A397JD33_9GLOM|nr:hypothetical protein Glove_103g265 [Diversispora epigaea]
MLPSPLKRNGTPLTENEKLIIINIYYYFSGAISLGEDHKNLYYASELLKYWVLLREQLEMWYRTGTGIMTARNQTQRGEPQYQYYKKDYEDHDPASTRVKRGTWDIKSQMSLASAHIKRLLSYYSYKVYPKALAEIARSSAHIPNLLI